MRIKKIDLYILTEVIGPFIGGVAFFSFVFLMFQVLRLAEFFIIHGIAGLTLAKMAGLMILSFLPTALPIAFLIGILIAFGRLSADSELVAMKANGISIYRLTAPVLFLGTIVVGLSLGLNMEWVPWGDRTFKSTLIKVSNTKVATSIKEGTFTAGFFDLLIYADKLDTKTNRLQNVFIYDEREAKHPLAVIAREGEIVTVKNDTGLGSSAMLVLYSGNIHSSEPATNAYQKIDFDEYKLFLKIDEGADTATIKPRMIPYDVLTKKIHEGDKNDPHVRELMAEFWRRYSVAFSPMIFVFLGIGYGTVRTRAVRAGAALIALLVVAIYWAIQAFATIAAQKGYLPPALAMQLPNIAMAIISVFGFRTATW